MLSVSDISSSIVVTKLWPCAGSISEVIKHFHTRIAIVCTGHHRHCGNCRELFTSPRAVVLHFGLCLPLK